MSSTCRSWPFSTYGTLLFVTVVCAWTWERSVAAMRSVVRCFIVPRHDRSKTFRAMSNCDRHGDQRTFLWQRTPGSLDFRDLLGDQPREFAIDFLLVRSVTDAADEKVGAVAHEELIFFAPLYELEIISFHGCTSRMADLTSFS